MKQKTKWTAVTIWVILLAFSGVALAQGGRLLCDYLQFTENSAPSVSGTSKAVMYADSSLHQLQSSINGGAYGSVAQSNIDTQFSVTQSFIANAGITGYGGGPFVITTANAGQLTVSSSAGSGAADGGAVVVSSGTSGGGSTGNGGKIQIFCNSAASTNGNGGDIEAQSGTGSGTGRGGNIYLSVKGSTGAGVNGNIYVGNVLTATGTTNISAQILGTGGSGTNNAGGGIIVGGGAGTGTAKGGNFKVQTTPSIATGSTAQTLADRYIVVAQGTALSDAVATTIATWTLTNGSSAGGRIVATIQCTNGTDFQSMTQYVELAIVNKAGTYTSNIVSTTGAKAVSAGTLTTTWTITSAGAVQLNADTSLTPSGTNGFVCYYVIENNSQSNVTLP